MKIERLLTVPCRMTRFGWNLLREWRRSRPETVSDVWGIAEILHECLPEVGWVPSTSEPWASKLAVLHFLLSDRGIKNYFVQSPESSEIPPEIRVIIIEYQILPSLLLIWEISGIMGHDRKLIDRAIEEGLDSMLSLAHGLLLEQGRSTKLDLPEPIDLLKLEEQWRVVQGAWGAVWAVMTPF